MAANRMACAARLRGEQYFPLRDQRRVLVLLRQLLGAPRLERIEIELLRDASLVLPEGLQRRKLRCGAIGVGSAGSDVAAQLRLLFEPLGKFLRLQRDDSETH